MARLKPGDRVTCRVKGGRIVSSYSGYEEEKEFEIIAFDAKGYFLYVPDHYAVAGTTRVSPNNLNSLGIDRKFMDCSMIYITSSSIVRVYEKLDGLTCSECKEFYKYAEANQEDGTLKCWTCRNYPHYR